MRVFFVKLFGESLNKSELYRGNKYFEKMREKAVKNRFRVFLRKVCKEGFEESTLSLLVEIF